MKISLRKAAALQNTINDLIKGIETIPTAKISEFEEPEAAIKLANETLIANMTRKDNLASVIYEIRKAVGSVNHTSGITDKLAMCALLEKRIQLYSLLAANKPTEALEIVKGKLAKLSAITPNPYDRVPVSEITVNVLDQEQITKFNNIVNSTKRSKQDIQDELIELNVRSEIPLSENAVNVLKNEGLV